MLESHKRANLTLNFNLPPYLRDSINLKIEQDPDLKRNLLHFSGKSIQIFFINEPLDGVNLIVDFGHDGLIDIVRVKKNNLTTPKSNNKEIKSDLTFYIDKSYLINLGSEFVGWGLDFETKELPNPLSLSSGLRMEGSPNDLQKIEPLLKLLTEKLAPIAEIYKESPANNMAKKIVDYILYEKKYVVVEDDYEIFKRKLRGLRSGLDRVEKKIEILNENKP